MGRSRAPLFPMKLTSSRRHDWFYLNNTADNINNNTNIGRVEQSHKPDHLYQHTAARYIIITNSYIVLSKLLIISYRTQPDLIHHFYILLLK